MDWIDGFVLFNPKTCTYSTFPPDSFDNFEVGTIGKQISIRIIDLFISLLFWFDLILPSIDYYLLDFVFYISFRRNYVDNEKWMFAEWYFCVIWLKINFEFACGCWMERVGQYESVELKILESK